MITLGIESTAHTFGASVLKDKKVLSNERIMFKADNGGMIPFKAAEHHLNNFDSVIKKALDTAKVGLDEIWLISYSKSPGLGNTLKIGAMAGRTLAQRLSVQIVGVNHCIAHLEIGKLVTKAKDPVLLYVSGANTQVIAFEGNKYRIFGETLDMGLGNFLDSFARELGIGFPGGPVIEKMAANGRNYVELPYVVKGMDISFGGILTNLKQKIKTGKYKKEDLCHSVQETVFSMMCEVSERALAHCDKKELLLGGGVACNRRLQQMANIMCKERGAKCFVPENQFLVDNAAMIGYLGYLMFGAADASQKKKFNVLSSGIDPYERTDDVEVYW